MCADLPAIRTIERDAYGDLDATRAAKSTAFVCFRRAYDIAVDLME